MYLLTSKYILFNYILRNMRIKIVQVGELEENCYIVEKNNKCLIIDPGSEFNKIKENIDQEVIGILTTHSHYDHVGALKEAKNYYNIKVYEYKNLKEGKITIGPFDIEVIYTKGHTNDSVTYYFKEEKIMFTGDFIFKNSIGRTDLGGNTKDMIESINKIKHYDDSIIIYPGHGEYTTLSSEKENNEFFNTLH